MFGRKKIIHGPAHKATKIKVETIAYDGVRPGVRFVSTGVVVVPPILPPF